VRRFTGTIAYLTQAGYAIGLFFLWCPLRQTRTQTQYCIPAFASVVVSILQLTAQSYLVLEIVTLLILGITSIVPQLILPLASLAF
jgi:hypothetical protein